MQSAWLNGTKDQERENLKNYIISNKKMLDILNKILYNMYREVENSSYDYDSPSWAHKQAHINGVKETLNKIMKLCEV
jgi:hypothetical protein